MRTRLAAACVVATTLLAIGAAPVAASPSAPLRSSALIRSASSSDGGGLTGSGPSGVHPNLLTGGVQYGYTCAVLGNPDPQYSSSNRTLHWGLKFYCDHVALVSIKGQLQEKEGSTWTVQDPFPATGWYGFTASNWGTTRSINCVDNVPHEWRIVVWVIIDGTAGTPNPGISSTYTLNCE